MAENATERGRERKRARERKNGNDDRHPEVRVTALVLFIRYAEAM